MSNFEFFLFNWGMLINFVIGVLALLTVLIYTIVFLIRKKKMSLKIYISIMLIMSGILYFTYPDLVANYLIRSNYGYGSNEAEFKIKLTKDTKIYDWAGDKKYFKTYKAGYYFLANEFLSPLNKYDDWFDIKEYGGCRQLVNDYFKHSEYLCKFDKSYCTFLEIYYMAIDDFDKIIDLETNYLNDSKCHYMLGLTYMYKGEYQKAIDVFDEMEKEKCTGKVQKTDYAWAYKGLKDYKKALEILNNKDDKNSIIVKANIYYDLRDMNKVKELYDTRKEPKWWTSYDEFIKEIKYGQFGNLKNDQKRLQQCLIEK